MEGEEFPTKNEDLEGFWDMLMLQVVQVHELFEQIERLKNAKWQEVCPVTINPKPSSWSTSRRTKMSKNSKPSNGILDPNHPNQSKKSKYYSTNSRNQLELKVETLEKLHLDNTKIFETNLRKFFINSKSDIRRLHSRTFKFFDECRNRSNPENSDEQQFKPNFMGLKSQLPNFFGIKVPYDEVKNKVSILGHCAAFPVKCNAADSLEKNFENRYFSYSENNESFPQIKPELIFEMHATKNSQNIENLRTKSHCLIDKGKKITVHFLIKDKFYSRSLKTQRDSSVSSKKEFSSQRPMSTSPLVKSPANPILERRKAYCSSLYKNKSLNNELTNMSSRLKVNSSVSFKKETPEKKNWCKTSLRSRSLDSRQKSKHSVTFLDDRKLDVKTAFEKNFSTETCRKDSFGCVSSKYSEPNHFLSLEKKSSLIKSKKLKSTQPVLCIKNISSLESNLKCKIQKAFKKKEGNFKSNLQSHIPVHTLAALKKMSSRICMRDKIINYPKVTINKFSSKGGFFEKSRCRRYFHKSGIREGKGQRSVNLLGSKTLLKSPETEVLQSNRKEDKCSNSDFKTPRISKLRPPSSCVKKHNLSFRDDSKNRFSSSKSVETDKCKENQIQSLNLNRIEQTSNMRSSSFSPRKNQNSETRLIERNSRSLEREPIDGRDDNINREIKYSALISENPEILSLNIRSVSTRRKMDLSTSFTSTATVTIKRSLKSIKTNSLECEDKVEIKSHNTVTNLKSKNLWTKDRRYYTVHGRKKDMSVEKKEDFLATEKCEQSKNFTRQKKLSVVTNVWPNLNSCDENSLSDKTKPQEKTTKVAGSRSIVSSKCVSKSSKKNSKNFPNDSKKTRQLIKKCMNLSCFSNVSKLNKMKKYDTKRKAELIINSLIKSHNSKFMPDNVDNRHQEVLTTEDEDAKNQNDVVKLLNMRVAEESLVDLQMRILLEKKKTLRRFVSNVIPCQNSEMKKNKLKQRSRSTTRSLASFSDSETGLMRVALETSRIIRSKCNVKGMFNPNREENNCHYQLASKTIRSFIESLENVSTRVNVRRVCNFFKSNKTLCRLSLYLYVYGMLSLILILLKINSCKYCFLGNKILYNLN